MSKLFIGFKYDIKNTLIHTWKITFTIKTTRQDTSTGPDNHQCYVCIYQGTNYYGKTKVTHRFESNDLNK